jgi:type IV pilus assembly protein PilM
MSDTPLPRSNERGTHGSLDDRPKTHRSDRSSVARAAPISEVVFAGAGPGSLGQGGTRLANLQNRFKEHVVRLGKRKPAVGLDIGSSAVKAVQLTPAGRGFRVSAFGTEPVPPGSIVDGSIVDSGAVAEAITRLFENKAFMAREVASAVSGHAVIARRIRLAAMSERELSDSIYWDAEQYIPFDIQDVNLDHQILEVDRGGAGTMDVLLVAAKREKIADYVGVIRQAGRVPVILDVDAFALQNAYELNYGVSHGFVALLNAGASAINLSIVSGGRPVFTRDIAVGGHAYSEAVQKELNLPFEAAEQAKMGQSVQDIPFAEVRPVLHEVTEIVLLEIQKTFDFFKASSAFDRIDRIVLSGGACLVDGFAQAIHRRFKAFVDYFDPFRTIAFDPVALGGPRADRLVPTLAVAVGLALRRAGGR